MIIKEISVNDVLPIRHVSMWPDKPFDFVRVPEDENAIHLGLYVDRKLVSVVSVFFYGSSAQFRKFGTLPDFQRKGYGSKLLVYMIRFLKERSVQKLWCNARVNKAEFYSNFGFVTTENTFQKSGIEYVVMERGL